MKAPVHRAVLVAPLLALLVLAGCGNEPAAAGPLPDDLEPVSADRIVAVLDNRFETDELVVEVDQEVTWVWEGRAAHDVVGPGFDSGIQSTGEFLYTFDEPGAYDYVCTLHPGMEGTVFVAPAEG